MLSQKYHLIVGNGTARDKTGSISNILLSKLTNPQK
jgi:hypothetical protein